MMSGKAPFGNVVQQRFGSATQYEFSF